LKNFLLGLCLLLSAVSFSQEVKIYVGDVSNNIKIGTLAGNKNLVLGVKNIAEEAIMDKGYSIVGKNDSTYKISFEVVYFDVLQTSAGVSVFHKNDNETIIRIKGVLTKGGKKIKEYLGTGKSSEISTSTMIIDEGGGFNQASARSALKKTIINVIETVL
jgi:uncharacterized lipoprotein YajG